MDCACPAPALRADRQIQLLLEQIIFRNPGEACQSSRTILQLLSDSFSKLISGPQFDYLLGYAAHTVNVDLLLFGPGARPGWEGRSENLADNELRQVGLDAIRLVAALMGLLIGLIGEYLTLRQFHIALTPVADSRPGNDCQARGPAQ